MTSSEFRGLQTFPRHLPFPKMILGKIAFYGKIQKRRNRDLIMNKSNETHIN